MKLSLVNFHELAIKRIKTYQVHNNSSMFMKLSVVNISEQTLN